MSLGSEPGSTQERARPLVSAIVTTYNSSEHITDTLNTLTAQTWDNMEILIGDDSSQDETPKLLSRFASQCGKSVTLFLRDKNLGWIRNTNDLLLRSRGKYAFFAFHDDLVEPTFVEKMVAQLENSEGASLAFSDVLIIDTDGSQATWSFSALDRFKSPLAQGVVMGRRPGLWWVAIHGVFRRDVGVAIGGLHQHDAGEIGADWPWLLHLSVIGEFIRVPEVLVTKKFTKQSLSRSWRPTLEQRRALKKAGVSEINSSTHLDKWKKRAMVFYLRMFIFMPSWLGPLVLAVKRRARKDG